MEVMEKKVTLKIKKLSDTEYEVEVPEVQMDHHIRLNERMADTFLSSENDAIKAHLATWNVSSLPDALEEIVQMGFDKLREVK